MQLTAVQWWCIVHTACIPQSSSPPQVAAQQIGSANLPIFIKCDLSVFVARIHSPFVSFRNVIGFKLMGQTL